MLSIVILTRNRKNEVIRALQSCLACALPGQTEFVIVDNASQDGTGAKVADFFGTVNQSYKYIYLPENIGVAAGRNVGFKQASCRYVYFLDDDAFIENSQQDFFFSLINFLETHGDVFCVTTGIYDTAEKGYRTVRSSSKSHQCGYHRIFMFHGGSCMIDRERWFFEKPLYLEQQVWGMEELFPSISNYARGKFIAEIKRLNIIHSPSPNSRFDKEKYILLVCKGATMVKTALFPAVVRPILFLFYYLRIIKHLGFKGLKQGVKEISPINKGWVEEPITLKTLLKMAFEFGLAATF